MTVADKPDEGAPDADAPPASAIEPEYREGRARDRVPFVVGIGASAGGLEALRKLLPGLPRERAVYVIVQHQAKDHRSLLVDLLRAYTSMPVRALDDRKTPRPGELLIAPSGFDVVLEAGTLRLRKHAQRTSPRPSIDRFFGSIAVTHGERAIGIVLSGTGRDGAHGVRAIKAGGGFTIAQDPSTAKYDGMPRAALDTGCVDLRLAPEAIGEELGRLLGAPPSSEGDDADDPNTVMQLLELIRVHNDADFSGYKRSTILRRITRRMTLHKLPGLVDYVRFARARPDELDALTKDILISVTQFFRDRDAFEVLRQNIPNILARKRPGDSIRVWVPGCATGEEAYSIAILFALALGEDFGATQFMVFGTDIDGDAIAHARRGEYAEISLMHVEPEILDQFFVRSDHAFQVVKALREHIVFARQDLIHQPPFSRLDLISCRNVLIYFDPDVQARVLPLFHYALEPGGYLMLGRSESIGAFSSLFKSISRRWRLFTSRPTRSSLPAPARATQAEGAAAGRAAPVTRGLSMRELAQRTVAELYDAPAVLVDENDEVVHIMGNTGPLLRLPEGDTGLNIIKLCPEVVRAPLRATLYKSRRERATITSRQLRWGSGADAPHLCLRVRQTDAAPKELTLILFEVSAPPVSAKASRDESVHERERRINELEQDLAANLEHLQAATEELEAANEELQSLNEELQSANEELQSSNEELEAANEELQAANEELTIVNEEIAEKSSALSQVNTDLENILSRMGIPLVVVDLELRVRRFTPPAKTIFHLVKGERGQPLESLGHNIDIAELDALVRAVIEEERSRVHAVVCGARHYELRVFPYVEEDGRVSGALMTFYDQTELNTREQEFRALVENAPDVIARFDRELKHVYVNRAIERATGLEAARFLGRSNRELGMPPAVCDEWEAALRRVFATGEKQVMQFTVDGPDGPQHFHSRLVPEFGPDGAVRTVLTTARDTTRLVASEREAERAARRTRELLDSISDGFFALDHELRVTYFNKPAGELLGRDPEDMVGRPLLDGFPEARGSILERRFTRALRERVSMSFETYFNAGAYDDWFRVRVYPKSEGISVYFQIVTEEKRAEQEHRRLQDRLKQASKMEAVGTLAGGVAHEFNNLLTIIMGRAEVALRQREREADRDADLETILAASTRGAELVQKILEFSRHNPSELRPVNLVAEVQRSLELLERTIPRMIDVSLRTTAREVVVNSDGGLIQQIILNLASNAVDAMPEGGSLRVSVEIARPDEERVEELDWGDARRLALLSVKDTGTGMSPRTLEKAFDPFYTTKEVGAGTGLGLSIVYGIVKEHGGHVTCASDPGRGTCVRIYLPLLDQPAEDEDEDEPKHEAPRGGAEMILIVDDEDAVRELAAVHLRGRGYRVLEAASGEEAVELYRARGDEIDGVLLDLSMPGSGGRSCLQQLKRLDARARVLILTGYAQHESTGEFEKLGAAGTIAKPYRGNTLLARVRAMLDEES